MLAAEMVLATGAIRQSIAMPRTQYNRNRACTLTASVSAREGYASLSSDGKVFMFGKRQFVSLTVRNISACVCRLLRRAIRTNGGDHGSACHCPCVRKRHL
jgi:hypothetical protein